MGPYIHALDNALVPLMIVIAALVVAAVIGVYRHHEDGTEIQLSGVQRILAGIAALALLVVVGLVVLTVVAIIFDR